MKTKIPASIATPETAKAFFAELEKNGELFHIEDDAKEMDFLTTEEADLINNIIEEAFEKLGAETLWEQMPDKCFLYKDKSGRGFTNKLEYSHIMRNFDLTLIDDSDTPLEDFLNEADEGAEWNCSAEAFKLTRIN